MSVKNIFAAYLEEQKLELAKQTIRSALSQGIPPKMTLGAVIDDLQTDPHLWEAFRALKFSELKALLTEPAAPGIGKPSRKRGVTANRIIQFVAHNPGARRKEIIRGLGLKGGTISSQLRTLRATGRLQGEGHQRNLQYYVP